MSIRNPDDIGSGAKFISNTKRELELLRDIVKKMFDKDNPDKWNGMWDEFCKACGKSPTDGPSEDDIVLLSVKDVGTSSIEGAIKNADIPYYVYEADKDRAGYSGDLTGDTKKGENYIAIPKSMLRTANLFNRAISIVDAQSAAREGRPYSFDVCEVHGFGRIDVSLAAALEEKGVPCAVRHDGDKTVVVVRSEYTALVSSVMNQIDRGEYGITAERNKGQNAVQTSYEPHKRFMTKYAGLHTLTMHDVSQAEADEIRVAFANTGIKHTLKPLDNGKYDVIFAAEPDTRLSKYINLALYDIHARCQGVRAKNIEALSENKREIVKSIDIKRGEPVKPFFIADARDPDLKVIAVSGDGKSIENDALTINPGSPNERVINRVVKDGQENEEFVKYVKAYALMMGNPAKINGEPSYNRNGKLKRQEILDSKEVRAANELANKFAEVDKVKNEVLENRSEAETLESKIACRMVAEAPNSKNGDVISLLNSSIQGLRNEIKKIEAGEYCRSPEQVLDDMMREGNIPMSERDDVAKFVESLYGIDENGNPKMSQADIDEFLNGPVDMPELESGVAEPEVGDDEPVAGSEESYLTLIEE